jgi:hypothetical protein
MEAEVLLAQEFAQSLQCTRFSELPIPPPNGRFLSLASSRAAVRSFFMSIQTQHHSDCAVALVQNPLIRWVYVSKKGTIEMLHLLHHHESEASTRQEPEFEWSALPSESFTENMVVTLKQSEGNQEPLNANIFAAVVLGILPKDEFPFEWCFDDGPSPHDLQSAKCNKDLGCLLGFHVDNYIGETAFGWIPKMFPFCFGDGTIPLGHSLASPLTENPRPRIQLDPLGDYPHYFTTWCDAMHHLYKYNGGAPCNVSTGNMIFWVAQLNQKIKRYGSILPWLVESKTIVTHTSPASDEISQAVLPIIQAERDILLYRWFSCQHAAIPRGGVAPDPDTPAARSVVSSPEDHEAPPKSKKQRFGATSTSSDDDGDQKPAASRLT